MRTARTRLATQLAKFLALAALCAATAQPAVAQSTASKPPQAADGSVDANGRVVTHQSVTVTGEIPPESKENDKLMQTFSAAVAPSADNDCAAMIDRLRTTLIPEAEQAQFPHNKAMYLDMAYTGIGRCQMKQGQNAEAEKSLREAIAQHEVFVGNDHPDSPILWAALSTSQLRQEHWKDAAASALKSAEICQIVIDEDVKRAAGREPPAEVEEMGQRRAAALASLAYAYMKEGRLDDAAKTIEEAYQQADAANLKGNMRVNILSQGKNISALSGNSGEIAKWVARADAPTQPASVPLPVPKP